MFARFASFVLCGLALVSAQSPYQIGAPVNESICSSADRSRPVDCYASSRMDKYLASKAVARLLINGGSLCTGWLIGSEGHLITNNHCIGSNADATATKVELMARCSECDDPVNDIQLACKGTIVAESTTLVTTNYDLDFALVKLNLKSGVDLSQYGYLKVRDGPPVANEPIWLAGHPQGRPERLAFYIDNFDQATITSPNVGTTCRANEAGYKLDTEAGSSGSPVMSTVDNTVVALHNCGGCPTRGGGGQNSGIPINNILAYLRNNKIPIPNDAIATTTTPTPSPTPTTPTPSPTPTTTQPANLVNFCTISNRVISEYYSNLYIGALANNANEKFSYDSTTGLVQVQSNNQCLDSYWDGSTFKVHTWPCDASNQNQQWTVGNNQVKHRVHGVCLTTVPGQTYIDVAACNANDIRQYVSTSCSNTNVRNFVRIQTKRGNYLSEYYTGVFANTPQNSLNELFEIQGNMIKAATNGQCFDAYYDGQGKAQLHTYPCNPSNGNQQWNVANGKIVHATHWNLCLDVDPNDPNHGAQVWQCYPNNDNQVFNVLGF